MSITIPSLDSECVLRHVVICGHGQHGRLLTWDATKRYQTGQCMVGYAYWPEGAAEPLFVGDSIGVPASECIDSDASLVSVLRWLVLKPGDTDSEFFTDHTPAQLAWLRSDACGELAMIVCDTSCPDTDSDYRYLAGRDGVTRLAGAASSVFVDVDI